MKVSLNTLKQFTSVELPLDNLVHKINSQLGGVEEIIELGAKYVGATIVKIVSCSDHPNADRLHVCLIDDGGVTEGMIRDENGYVQVVCGAPNARAGIMVVWLPPGSTVPASFGDKEPFVLDARKLRGVVSNGMLASPKELGIGDDHDGILEVDDDKNPGQSFAAAYGLDDQIIDIENKMFTHRPDCFGVLGVAREIAGIQHRAFQSPSWYVEEPGFVSGDGLDLTVKNEAHEVVPRFMAVAIKDVAVKPSPLWLQCELIRLGGKPINNIVDVTNYCMLLTGQPLHAYDYDKVSTGKLGVRYGKKNETVALLNGKTLAVTTEDIVITDGTKPIGLGGIMGGSGTEVDAQTTNIVLECATFDMYKIRKSSMRHGLFTEAVTRFNKGQSPLQNPHVMSVALSSINDVAGGQVASQLFDASAELAPRPVLAVNIDFINQRLGTALTVRDAAQLLTNVELGVEVKKNTLHVTPAFWRTDLELSEDIVEEVGRLYGFDKLPRELPVRSITPAAKNPAVEAKQLIRERLARQGANEVLSYSFVHENVIKRATQDPIQAFKLGNALSPELQYYRLSILPSLLSHVHGNIKAGHDEFALFEIGKAHGKSEFDDDGLPKEFGRVACVFAANKKAASTHDGSTYYLARRYVDELFAGRTLTYRPLTSTDHKDHILFQQMLAPFDVDRSAAVYSGDKLVGVVGELKPSVRQAFKLPDYAAGFELFLSAFDAAPSRNYRPLSRFPSVTQDISLKVKADVAYADVEEVIATVVSELDDTYRADITPLGVYRPDEGETKTITFRINVVNYEKTLNDKAVGSIVEQIAQAAAQKIDATRV